MYLILIIEKKMVLNIIIIVTGEYVKEGYRYFPSLKFWKLNLQFTRDL